MTVTRPAYQLAIVASVSIILPAAGQVCVCVMGVDTLERIRLPSRLVCMPASILAAAAAHCALSSPQSTASHSSHLSLCLPAYDGPSCDSVGIVLVDVA